MFWEEMGPIPHLILFRAVEKPFFIYSHLSCYLLEIIVSCYVLVLGEEGKKDKKYLTIKFISVFFFFLICTGDEKLPMLLCLDNMSRFKWM